MAGRDSVACVAIEKKRLLCEQWLTCSEGGESHSL